MTIFNFYNFTKICFRKKSFCNEYFVGSVTKPQKLPIKTALLQPVTKLGNSDFYLSKRLYKDKIAIYPVFEVKKKYVNKDTVVCQICKRCK